MPSRAKLLVAAAVACFAASTCARGPTAPTAIAAGRWSGDGVCLSVSDQVCDLVAGCGHGRFPPPSIGRDGTFEVQGTYRVEVGPIGVEPPPPATFSGLLTDRSLTLTVTPRDPRVPPATYVLRLTSEGAERCAVLCL
jgi:hypothetical protein